MAWNGVAFGTANKETFMRNAPESSFCDESQVEVKKKYRRERKKWCKSQILSFTMCIFTERISLQQVIQPVTITSKISSRVLLERLHNCSCRYVVMEILWSSETRSVQSESIQTCRTSSSPSLHIWMLCTSTSWNGLKIEIVIYIS